MTLYRLHNRSTHIKNLSVWLTGIREANIFELNLGIQRCRHQLTIVFDNWFTVDIFKYFSRSANRLHQSGPDITNALKRVNGMCTSAKERNGSHRDFRRAAADKVKTK